MQKVKPLAIKGDVRIGYLQQLSYLFFLGIANMYIDKIKVVDLSQL